MPVEDLSFYPRDKFIQEELDFLRKRNAPKAVIESTRARLVQQKERGERYMARQEKAASKFEKIIEAAGKRLQDKVYPAAKKGEEQLGLKGSRGKFNTKVVKMKPDTFFRGIQEQYSVKGPLLSSFEDPVNTAEGFLKNRLKNPKERKSFANLLRRFSGKEPIDIPQLGVDIIDQTFQHEGRHRVALAKALGIKEVPVLTKFFKNKRELYFGDAGKNKISTLKNAIERVSGLSELKAGKSLIARIFNKIGTGKAAAVAGLSAIPVLSQLADAYQGGHLIGSLVKEGLEGRSVMNKVNAASQRLLKKNMGMMEGTGKKGW